MLKDCGFGSRAVVEPAFIFRNILFDVGQAALKSESMPQIQEIGAALLAIGKVNIMISGHTDKQTFKGHTQEESVELNKQLSNDRAASVADELARLGVERNRIVTAGYGQAQPLVDGDTEAAYAQNRRVTIEVR